MSVNLDSITGIALLDTTTNPGTVVLPDDALIGIGHSIVLKAVNNPSTNTLTIDGNGITLQGPTVIQGSKSARQVSFVIDGGTPTFIGTGGSVYDTFQAETILLTSTLFNISSGWYPNSNTPTVPMDVVISQLTGGFGTSSLSTIFLNTYTHSNLLNVTAENLSTTNITSQYATFSTIGLSSLPFYISSGYAYWNEEIVASCNTVPVPNIEYILSTATASTGQVLQSFRAPHTALQTRISFASAAEVQPAPQTIQSFLVNTSSFSGTIVLPQASTIQGGFFIFLDEHATFPINPLTLSTTENDTFYPSLSNHLEITAPATTLVALQENRWKLISQTKSSFSTFYPTTSLSFSTTTSTLLTSAFIAPTHAHLQSLVF